VASRSAFWFIGVGIAATLVHFSVVVGLVSHALASPLAANVVAWGVAFMVSFLGHWRLSFATQQAPARRAVGRFFLVSAAAFALNQLAYWLLLRAGWNYGVALAAVLAMVALATYLVSRHWAFAARRPR
jgi:putative flippase GtrA